MVFDTRLVLLFVFSSFTLYEAPTTVAITVTSSLHAGANRSAGYNMGGSNTAFSATSWHSLVPHRRSRAPHAASVSLTRLDLRFW